MGYRATKLFDTAISNNKKLEKEIKIQRETVQLAGGWGRSAHALRGIPVPIAESTSHESKLKVAQRIN